MCDDCNVMEKRGLDGHVVKFKNGPWDIFLWAKCTSCGESVAGGCFSGRPLSENHFKKWTEKLRTTRNGENPPVKQYFESY